MLLRGMNEKNKKYFIIKKDVWTNEKTVYTIMNEDEPLSLEATIKKLLAYDELNRNKKSVSYHSLEISSDLLTKAENKKNSNGEVKQLSLFP